MTAAHGTCIAIVHRLHDDDNKLVVVANPATGLDDAAIAAAIGRQETTGHYIIVRH